MFRRGGVLGCRARLWILVCLAAAHTAHTQDMKLLTGETRMEGTAPQRGLRTPDAASHQRSEGSFWAARGKRPAAGARHTRSAEGDLQMSWAPVEQDLDASQGGAEGGGTGMGSGGAGPGTTFWVTRGKKDLEEYLPFYWGSNQGMWGATLPRSWAAPPHLHQQQEEVQSQQQKVPSRTSLHRSGWESNQSLWGKRGNQGPFWVARGKKQDDGPFWISRGKRPQLVPDLPTYSSLWAVRGRKSGGDNFWITKGKKEDVSSGGAPYWVARGKKEEGGSVDPPFWIARGKKAEVTSPTAPYWVARGKKEVDESAEAPFWIARGKKNEVTTMTTPYWIARGKKDDPLPPFWISRGKKEGQGDKFWVARGKKEGAKHHFWIARGKRSGHEMDHEEDDEEKEEREEEEREEMTNYILEGLARKDHNTTQAHAEDKEGNAAQDTGEKEALVGEEQKEERHPFLNGLLALRG